MTATTPDRTDRPLDSAPAGADGARRAFAVSVRRARHHRRRRRRLAGLVLALLLVVAGAFVLAAYKVRVGAWRMAPVATAGGQPGSSVGTLAVAQRVPVARVQAGDVLLVGGSSPQGAVVRRVVAVHENGPVHVLTTSVASTSQHDRSTLTVVRPTVYRVRFSLPLLGHLARWLHSSTGSDALVAVAALDALVLVGWLALWGRPGVHSRARRSAGAALDEEVPESGGVRT